MSGLSINLYSVTSAPNQTVVVYGNVVFSLDSSGTPGATLNFSGITGSVNRSTESDGTFTVTVPVTYQPDDANDPARDSGFDVYASFDATVDPVTYSTIIAANGFDPNLTSGSTPGYVFDQAPVITAGYSFNSVTGIPTISGTVSDDYSQGLTVTVTYDESGLFGVNSTAEVDEYGVYAFHGSYCASPPNSGDKVTVEVADWWSRTDSTDIHVDEGGGGGSED